METIGYNPLTGLKRTNYTILMEKRIKKVLMICSSYDAYTLEEDGQIEVQLYREYVDLNISNPPTFTSGRSIYGIYESFIAERLQTIKII